MGKKFRAYSNLEKRKIVDNAFYHYMKTVAQWPLIETQQQPTIAIELTRAYCDLLIAGLGYYEENVPEEEADLSPNGSREEVK